MERKGKILLTVNGKEKYYPNKERIKILRKNNPKEKFRIAICKDIKREVMQVKDSKSWMCLHN